jgi:hypothetical protein
MIMIIKQQFNRWINVQNKMYIHNSIVERLTPAQRLVRIN